jgi:hypothetical protein
MKTRDLTLLLAAFLLVSCSTAVNEVGPPIHVDTGVDTEAWKSVPAGPFFEGLHAHKVFLQDHFSRGCTPIPKRLPMIMRSWSPM